MAIQHLNRKGKTYHLHQGTTKTGKPKYFFSMKTDGNLIDKIPSGYEIYENPNGQVFLRKAQPKLITDAEKQLVEEVARANPDVGNSLVEIKKKQIIIHTPNQDIGSLASALGDEFGVRAAAVKEILSSSASFSPMMRFDLEDDEDRSFVAFRYCFRGSIDDWIYIGGPDKLSQLVEKFVPHLGKDSFYDLY